MIGGVTTKRKIISVLLVLMLVFSLAVPACAASGLNQAELQVIKMLDKGVKINTDFYQYRNALKVYFNRDNISITQVQADTVCGILLDYYDTYVPENTNNAKQFFNMLIDVLMYLRVRVIYDRSSKTINLIGNDGSLVMSHLKLNVDYDGNRSVELVPIKQTGTSLAQLLWMVIPGVTLGAAAIIFIIMRRKGTVR